MVNVGKYTIHGWYGVGLDAVGVRLEDDGWGFAPFILKKKSSRLGPSKRRMLQTKTYKSWFGFLKRKARFSIGTVCLPKEIPFSGAM